MFNRFSKTKYGNKKVEHAGRRFDSKLEAALYDYLLLLEKAGELSDIHSQETIYLSDARIIYKPDYSAVDTATGVRKYHEAKGFETTDWRIKRRLWMSYGPAPLLIYKGSARSFKLHETLVPKVRE